MERACGERKGKGKSVTYFALRFVVLDRKSSFIADIKSNKGYCIIQGRHDVNERIKLKMFPQFWFLFLILVSSKGLTKRDCKEKEENDGPGVKIFPFEII